MDEQRVDPLSVLPLEIMHLITAMLPPSTLVQLWEVSKDWRVLARSSYLWRKQNVSLRSVQQADSFKILLRAPCFGELELPFYNRSPKIVKALSNMAKVSVQ